MEPSSISKSAVHADPNPFRVLLAAIGDDPGRIQDAFTAHREQRNQAQRSRLLDPAFTTFEIDPILYKLVNSLDFPNFEDPRHCMVFWARPTQCITDLVRLVQDRLLEAVPGLWLMPSDALHMTTLEVAHSRPRDGPSSVSELLAQLSPCVEAVANYTFDHRTCLVRPLLSFDASAFALSFVPAAGETGDLHGDSYTYLHLRRDIFDICVSTRTPIASRYVVPSCHLTIGRFISQQDFGSGPEGHATFDHSKVQNLVHKIEDINSWLRRTYWSQGEATVPPGGSWKVGEEQGLEARQGTLWYGGGKRVFLGKGF